MPHREYVTELDAQRLTNPFNTGAESTVNDVLTHADAHPPNNRRIDLGMNAHLLSVAGIEDAGEPILLRPSQGCRNCHGSDQVMGAFGDGVDVMGQRANQWLTRCNFHSSAQQQAHRGSNSREHPLSQTNAI